MILLVLVIAAFALRLWVLQSIPVIDTDGVTYVALAKQFQTSGSPFGALFHPLYPFCLAIVQPLVGDWELAGRLVSAISGALVLVPAHALARDVFGAEVALLSTTLMVVHPGLVLISTSVMSEALFTLVVVTGVWVTWRALNGGRRVLIPAAGLLFGIAYLARPEGSLYLIGIVIVGVALGVRGVERWPNIAGWMGTAVVLFFLAALPYLLYLKGVQGGWTLSGKIAHNLVLQQGLDDAPPPMARRIFENAFLFEKYALPDIVPGVLAFLVLPGLLARPWRPAWVTSEGVLLAAALPPFSSLAFHIESRIFFPTLPFLLPFAAQGTLWVAATVFGGRRTRVAAIVLIVVVALALLPYSLRPMLRPDVGAAVYRRVARWVAETQPADAILLDRKPFIAFYSDRRFMPLDRVGPDRLLAAAQHVGARLVVLDSRALPYDRPVLVPLIWGAPPPGFQVLRDFDVPPADRVRILQIRDGG